MFEINRPAKESGLGIYAQSVAVNPRKYRQLANDMCKWMDQTNGTFKGAFKRAFAIAHCQVANVAEPIKLFVLDADLVNPFAKEGDKQNLTNCFFESQAIFNAEILEAPDKITKLVPKRDIGKVKHGKVDVQIKHEERKIDNKIMVPEACMSFNEHNRKERNTERYHTIKVRYQYVQKWLPFLYVNRTFEGWVEGMKAHVIQHEVEHFEGKNMYGK